MIIKLNELSYLNLELIWNLYGLKIMNSGIGIGYHMYMCVVKGEGYHSSVWRNKTSLMKGAKPGGGGGWLKYISCNVEEFRRKVNNLFWNRSPKNKISRNRLKEIKIRKFLQLLYLLIFIVSLRKWFPFQFLSAEFSLHDP